MHGETQVLVLCEALLHLQRSPKHHLQRDQCHHQQWRRGRRSKLKLFGLSMAEINADTRYLTTTIFGVLNTAITKLLQFFCMRTRTLSQSLSTTTENGQ